MTPAGSISLAQENFRVTIADCPTFRMLVGAEDREETLEHLYHEGLPAPTDGTEHTKEEHEALRPWGIVYTAEHKGFSRRKESTGAFRSSGRLRLRLARSCEAVNDDLPSSEAMLEWKNIVGQIVGELAGFAIAAGPEHLCFDEISLDFGPFASSPELEPTQGVWQGAELSVAWGGS